MSRKVLKTKEIVKLPGALVVQAPKVKEDEDAGSEHNLSREALQSIKEQADRFRMRWNVEKESMIAQAKSDAESIIEEAEKRGEELIERKIRESEHITTEANEKASHILQDTETQSKKITEEATEDIENQRRLRYEESKTQGYEQGFQKGSQDASRIIEQLHNMLNKVVERRSAMVEEIEPQIIHLVLAIVRKVVKALSEEQRSVVVNNVVYALKKLKRKTDVVLRVNLESLGTINQHLERIIRLVSNVENVTVVEDTSVDPGGCIVETDFGQIDARIVTQLDEIEQRIKRMVPVKTEQPRQ